MSSLKSATLTWYFKINKTPQASKLVVVLLNLSKSSLGGGETTNQVA